MANEEKKQKGTITIISKKHTQTAEDITWNTTKGNITLNSAKSVKMYGKNGGVKLGDYKAAQLTTTLLVKKVEGPFNEKGELVKEVKVNKIYTFKATQFNRTPTDKELYQLQWAIEYNEDGKINTLKPSEEIKNGIAIKRLHINPESGLKHRVYAYFKQPAKSVSVDYKILRDEFLIVVIQGYGGNPPDGKERAKDSLGIDHAGLGGITELTTEHWDAKLEIYVYSSSSSENTKNAVLKLIKKFKQNSPDGKVIMVGHSMGADNIIELSKEHSDVILDLIITLDIKDASNGGIFCLDDNNINPNIKNAINYYQEAETIGGTEIDIVNTKTTKGVNILSPGSIHRSIDNDLLQYLKLDIKNFILGKDAVEEARKRTLPTFDPKDSNSEKISKADEKNNNIFV